jgi:hypothetical protein
VREPQRAGGEREGAGGGEGATAVGAGVVDGAAAAVERGGTGPFARGAAAWGPGCGDVVSVQTATSAPTPTTAVSVARAARVRARTRVSGRCSSIATDTAAQPKIARVAMTTAHRWDTRNSLCTAPSARRTAFRSFSPKSASLVRGYEAGLHLFPLAETQGGRIRSGPAEQVGTPTGVAIAQWATTGWSNRIPLIRFEAVVRTSVMSISRRLGSRLASRR